MMCLFSLLVKIKIQYYELWAMWSLLPNLFNPGGPYINEFVIGVALMNHPLYVTLFGAVVFTYMYGVLRLFFRMRVLLEM